MANNVKSEIKNTGFADIPCDETIHRDDNHIFHLCKWNIKDQFIGYSDVIFTHKDTHRLLHPDYTNSLNSYNVTLSSATLSEIKSITNKYLSDKRIYIPVSLEKPNYYYLVARGSGKSIRELCYATKVMSNHSSHILSTTYSSEYKTQNYKSDMEMAFSGSCILNISPADDDAVIIEVAQKKEKKEENSKMEFDMNEIKSAIKETISEMNEKSEAYETQISELNTQIENKNTELAEKTSMIEEKDTKISELNASIADMQKLLDDMKKDQETTWAEMDILQKEIAKAKVAEKLGELDSALAEFSAEEKEVAKDDIEKLKSEISACEKKEELNSIDEKITAIKSEICMSIVAEQKKAAADAKIAEQNSARNDDVEDIFSEMCEDIDAEEKEEDTNIF